jgi:Phospholipase_D-nuclease N-terminal/Short C-terminal domain
VLVAENNYPLLEVFWTIIIFFAWVIWIWTVISVLGDVFRRHDLSGWGKAGWTFLVILVPFLGVLIYLISQGQGMAERSATRVKEAQTQYEEHIRDVAGSGGPATEIANAKALLDSGAITQAEFDQIKQKALG